MLAAKPSENGKDRALHIMRNVRSTYACWVVAVCMAHSAHWSSHSHQAIHRLRKDFSHFVRLSRKSELSRITSRAWGTLGLGVLLALILGLIARIPQSEIVLIAAIRCIGICSSSGASGLLLLLLLLLRVLLVTIQLLLVLIWRLRILWFVVVLILVI